MKKVSLFLIIYSLFSFPSFSSDTADDDGFMHQMHCDAGEPAKVVSLVMVDDGKIDFKVKTLMLTYQGIANPKEPKYLMEKQVLALDGKVYFCLLPHYPYRLQPSEG